MDQTTFRTEAVRARSEPSGLVFEASLPEGLPDLSGLGGPFDGVQWATLLFEPAVGGKAKSAA